MSKKRKTAKVTHPVDSVGEAQLRNFACKLYDLMYLREDGKFDSDKDVSGGDMVEAVSDSFGVMAILPDGREGF